MNCLLLVLLLIVSISCSSNNGQFRIVCFFGSSAYERQGDAKFTVNDIDPKFCTHLVYSFAVINFITYEVESLNPWREINNKGYENFTSLITKNPQLKLMIALTETINTKNVDYSNIVANNASMNALTENIQNFLDKFKFYGIVLEFSKWTHAKIKFVEALLKKKFFICAASSGWEPSHLDKGYVLRLSQNLDFLNLKTYEYYRPDVDSFADHHSPLYDRSWDTNTSVDFTVNQWLAKGFQPDKIVVGIPFFGIGWTLSSNETKPPAPAQGAGGPGTLMKGYMAYYEICLAIKRENWQVFQDSEQTMGPYAVSPIGTNSNRTWIGYDDPEMAIIKSNYIISKGLGGAMVRDISVEDFRNKCDAGPNPMLTAISKTLSKAVRPIFPKTMTPSVIALAVASVILFIIILFLLYLLKTV